MLSFSGISFLLGAFFSAKSSCSFFLFSSSAATFASCSFFVSACFKMFSSESRLFKDSCSFANLFNSS
jgi:hypothetical protein